MGSRRIARNGKGTAETAWSVVGPATGGIRGRLPAGCWLLLLRFSALGMAAYVLCWWASRPARNLCSSPGERVRSLEKDEARELGTIRTRNSVALEVIPLPGVADDDDELCLPRHPGYVPDPSQTTMGLQSAKGGGGNSLFNGRRHCRWSPFWTLVGPFRSPPFDDHSTSMCTRCYPSVGIFALAWIARGGWVLDAVYGSGCLGCHTGAPD